MRGGTVTVYRRKYGGGKVVYWLNYIGLDDLRKREPTTARTATEAQAFAAKKATELNKARILGAHSVDSVKPVLFEVFVGTKDKLGEYLTFCKANHTRKTYGTDVCLSKNVMPFFGKKTLRAIAPGDLQRFVDQRVGTISPKTGRPYTPSTINHELMFLSGALREAVKRGYIDRNPVQGVPTLSEHNQKLRWLTKEEEDRLFKFLPEYLRPITTCALHTGMRLGEVLTLKWADVDFRQRMIRVEPAKNHKERHIPMNERLVELLSAMKPASETWEESPHVFTSMRTGVRFDSDGVGHAFKRDARRAGLFGVSFHTLRHTFASRLAQRGVPLNDIRELLGHSDMRVTLRYAHLAPGNLRRAVEVLETEVPVTLASRKEAPISRAM